MQLKGMSNDLPNFLLEVIYISMYYTGITQLLKFPKRRSSESNGVLWYLVWIYLGMEDDFFILLKVISVIES